MVKKQIILILSFIILLSSCTLTTEQPNLIKGIWAYSAPSYSSPTESYSFNDKMEYTHITTKIENGSQVLDKEYTGTYTMSYNSFEVVKASGVITLKGQSDGSTENKTFNFTFETKPYANIRSLTLTNKNGTIVYGYSGDAV